MIITRLLSGHIVYLWLYVTTRATNKQYALQKSCYYSLLNYKMFIIFMYPYSVNMYVIIIIIIVKNGIFLVFRFGKDVLFTKVK